MKFLLKFTFLRFSKKNPDATKAKGAASPTEGVSSNPDQVVMEVLQNSSHSKIVRGSITLDAMAQHGSFEDQETSTETTSATTDGSFTEAGPSQNSGHNGVDPTGLFQKARNFVINNPTLGATVQINHQGDPPPVPILRELREHVIHGAEFNSSARDTPPRCLPGTRTRILEDIQTHLHDPDLLARMIWIHGSLGVGKSAIMQTLAEAESSRGSTFTTLFFSRPNERDDPKKAFPTLAYALAVKHSEYQRYIGERLHNDPTFLAKTMDEQFQHLFVTPFNEGRVTFGSERWFVFLDGLDECRGEKEQCRIIEFIRTCVLDHAAATPFVWIIASRPEAHLKSQFSQAKRDVETYWELEIPLDSEDSSRDVEKYLRTQFSDIHKNHAYSLPISWPSDRVTKTICHTSSGMFVFASTLVDYLLGGVPALRLNHILDVIEKSRRQKPDPLIRPLGMLDLLYTQIMADVPQEILSITKKLLGFYLVESILMVDKKPIPLLIASNTLKLTQHETYAALRKLNSVLACPSPDEAEDHPIRFYHVSFSDFLSDPSRSQEYHINLSEEMTHLWQCQTDILRQYGADRAPRDVELTWLPTDYVLTKRLMLLGSVQRRWAKTLVDYWTASPSDLCDTHLQVDLPSLVNVLRELGPTVFLGMEDLMFPSNIFTWFDDDAQEEVRRDLLVETFPLRRLDLDRLFKSLCTQRWCWQWRETSSGFQFFAVKLAPVEQFTVAQWMQAKEILWTPSSTLGELVRESDGIVRVVGSERADCHVIVGPITTSPGTTTYYILPYGRSEDS